MNTIFDESILDAMQVYNAAHKDAEQFTFVDARIMSLVHFYHNNSKQFLVSNDYLAAKCMVTRATVQKSINKLIAYGFITKNVRYISGCKRRTLTYQEDAVEQFKLTKFI